MYCVIFVQMYQVYTNVLHMICVISVNLTLGISENNFNETTSKASTHAADRRWTERCRWGLRWRRRRNSSERQWCVRRAGSEVCTRGRQALPRGWVRWRRSLCRSAEASGRVWARRRRAAVSSRTSCYLCCWSSADRLEKHLELVREWSCRVAGWPSRG